MSTRLKLIHKSSCYTNTGIKIMAETLDSLKSVLFAADGGMTLDLIAMDIKEAAEKIGNITGHEISEEVVMNIFERFCIGK